MIKQINLKKSHKLNPSNIWYKTANDYKTILPWSLKIHISSKYNDDYGKPFTRRNKYQYDLIISYEQR